MRNINCIHAKDGIYCAHKERTKRTLWNLFGLLPTMCLKLDDMNAKCSYHKKYTIKVRFPVKVSANISVRKKIS